MRLSINARLRTCFTAALLGTGLAAVTSHAATAAEATRIRIAQQFGIAYLPLTVVKERRLLETRTAASGQTVQPEWIVLSGAGAMNDALISSSLDLASAGIGPMILTWDKTRGTANFIGVASLGSMANVLMTNKPNIKSLADFTDADRIAMPAVKVGFQPIALQMAAEKQFGKYDKLDHLTVGMPHPDAAGALISGKLEITAHFTSPPFVQQILASGKGYPVLSTYDIVGGPHTFNVVYATQKFVDANPVTMAAFVAALDEANAWIIENPKEAAALYLRAEKSSLSQDTIEGIIKDPMNRFTTMPENTLVFAAFLSRVGLIKAQPATWKEFFFKGLHEREGS
jgi:NitT/TauT family transport system substrate-binding protein